MGWGIAFTGWQPEGNELPCPADHARGDAHTKWGGNTAKSTGVNPLTPQAHNHLGGKNVNGCPACEMEKE